MEKTPSKFLRKLAAELWQEPEQREAFEQALIAPGNFPQALIWVKTRPASASFNLEPRLSFQAEFVDRISVHERPGSDALHEQGCYYCLDFSSVFAASALLAIERRMDAILDMCASPGGKAVFAWRAHAPQLLLCNEVIGKRHAALISNLERLQIKNCMVTSSDSKYWADKLADSFDLVICDVPCSGQSLLARGQQSPGCFHPASINMNSNRQKRIIANSAKAVAPRGYLAYMTCTFSIQENESVIEWLLKKFPEFMAIEIPALAEFRSHLTEQPAYRLWPQSGLGAGAFVCLLLKSGEVQAQPIDLDSIYKVWPR